MVSVNDCGEKPKIEDRRGLFVRHALMGYGRNTYLEEQPQLKPRVVLEMFVGLARFPKCPHTRWEMPGSQVIDHLSCDALATVAVGVGVVLGRS